MLDLSVIIATYNRSRTLARTLEALAGLDTLGLAWEVVVADNNSRDDTPAVCRTWQGRLPLKYVFEGVQGKNAAYNTALVAASGSLIVTTDDDITPCRGWLKALWEAAQRWSEHDVFCGPVITPIPPAFEGTLEGAVPTCNFNPSGPQRVLEADVMPIGANLAFRRRCLQRAGGGKALFDPTIGPCGEGRISGSESVALQALMRGGRRIVYVPEASVLHETPAGFRSVAGLCRRAWFQGRGDVRVHHYAADAPRLAGMPRFVLRRMIEDFLATAGNLVEGRRKSSLARLFHGVRFLAICCEWRKAGRP